MSYLMMSISAAIFAILFVLWLFLNRQRKEYCFRLILINLAVLIGYLLLLYLMIPILPELHVTLFFILVGLIHLGAFGILLFRDLIKMLKL